jgi:hypothetical protein
LEFCSEITARPELPPSKRFVFHPQVRSRACGIGPVTFSRISIG